MIKRGNPGVVIMGRVYIGPTVQPAGAPIIDPCTTVAHRDDGTKDLFAGIVITPKRTMSRGLVLARRGGVCSHPSLWWWCPKALRTMRG